MFKNLDICFPMFNFNYSHSQHLAISLTNSNTNDNNSNDNIQNNFGKITNGKWTDAQRRIVWMLLVKARAGLKIEINPIVATAFVILQKYFRNLDQSDNENESTVNQYDLITLMTAALFTACKMKDETFRPMEIIFNELSKICMNAPSQKIRLIIASRVSVIGYNQNYTATYMVSQLCENDYKLISKCEIDLLDATGFDIDFDLPFRYFNEIIIMLNNLIPPDSMNAIYNTWLIDTCLMICSQYYLDLPPEVAAAAAVADSFQNSSNMNVKPIQQQPQPQLQLQYQNQDQDKVDIPVGIVVPEGAPQYIKDWVDNIRQKHGDRLFQLAQHAILEERQKTVPGPAKKGCV